MNNEPLKTGSITTILGTGAVVIHPANASRSHFLINNRESNTLKVYVSLAAVDPVIGGKCTFSLGPNDVYEWQNPAKPYTGEIRLIMSGAENVDITEIV